MKKIFAMALLAASLTATAQEDKSCMEWQNQFQSEVTTLTAELKNLELQAKTDKSSDLKAQVTKKKADLKAAKTNLKVAKDAVKSEKSAEKDLLKATKQATKLQQKKDKAQNAVIKAQQKAANADKKVTAAEQKLEQARQNADKAYSAVDKAKATVGELDNDGDIAESAIKKAQDQKAAAKNMIISKIVVRPDGSSGTTN